MQPRFRRRLPHPAFGPGLAAALVLAAAATSALAAAPAQPEHPKSGYEIFLEKGRILDFPARPWEQAFVYNSQCYSVRTNTSADVAEYAGVLMDAVNYHYRLRFGINSTQRSNICVFRTKGEMDDYARKRCQWSPAPNCNGFFTTADGGTICAIWMEMAGDRPDVVLMHEGTHQFVHAVFREALPIWLNEGFAVYFENSHFDGRNLDVGRVPAMRLMQLQAQMRQDKHVNLERLFVTEQKSFGVDHYGSAWAFVFWMAHGGDARTLQVHQAALGQYVADCRQGRKDGKVLATYLGRPGMADLDKEWKEWVLGLDPADPYGGIRPPDPRNFDPRANDVMQKVAAYYLSLKSLKVDFSGQDETGSFAMRRPGCLAMTVKAGDREYRLVSDGSKVAAGQTGSGRYQATNAPANPGAALGLPFATAAAMRTPSAELLVALVDLRPYNAVLRRAEKLEYFGFEDAGGSKCHHIRVLRKERGFELWVTEGDKPLVMKIAPLTEGGRTAGPSGTKPAAGCLFTNWSPNAELGDEVFKH